MSNPLSPVARASVFGSPTPSSLPATSHPPQPDNHLLLVFSSLLQTGKYSDLVIKCQGRKWKAHKAVVCSQSRPLAAAIDGNFMESATGEIDLEEDEPEIIGFMLEYFYTGDISIDDTLGSSENPVDLELAPQSSAPEPGLCERHQPIWGRQGPAPSISFRNSTLINSVQGASSGGSFCANHGYAPLPSNSPRSFANLAGSSLHDALPMPITAPVDPQNLVTLAAIYVTAEKFDVQPLKRLVKGKYEWILRTGWNTEHFVNSLKLIYDGTPDLSEPDDLRELAIRAAAIHAKELMDRGEFLDLCKQRGDFTTDVLKAALQQAAAPEACLGPGIGTGIPRCRVNSSHAIHIMHEPHRFGSQITQRCKCAICDTHID